MQKQSNRLTWIIFASLIPAFFVAVFTPLILSNNSDHRVTIYIFSVIAVNLLTVGIIYLLIRPLLRQ